MTKTEVITKIESLAASFGLETGAGFLGDQMPRIVRKDDANIDFTIRTNYDFDTFNKEEKSVVCNITASANICRMNPNSTADELLLAADEIRNGALFVEELNQLKLSFIEKA